MYTERKALSRLKAIVAAAIVDVVGGLVGWDGEPGCKMDHASCQRLRLSRQAQPDPRLVLLGSLAHVVNLCMICCQQAAQSMQPENVKMVFACSAEVT